MAGHLMVILTSCAFSATTHAALAKTKAWKEIETCVLLAQRALICQLLAHGFVWINVQLEGTITEMDSVKNVTMIATSVKVLRTLALLAILKVPCPFCLETSVLNNVQPTMQMLEEFANNVKLHVQLVQILLILAQAAMAVTVFNIYSVQLVLSPAHQEPKSTKKKENVRVVLLAARLAMQQTNAFVSFANLDLWSGKVSVSMTALQATLQTSKKPNVSTKTIWI